jgi:hypothetical protein
MKDSKTSLRRSLPELTQSEPLQQTLHLRSLIEWWQLAQHPDFTLDIQEWEHALREWKVANWPRCRCECDDLFDMCLNCITPRQLTDLVQ